MRQKIDQNHIVNAEVFRAWNTWKISWMIFCNDAGYQFQSASKCVDFWNHSRYIKLNKPFWNLSRKVKLLVRDVRGRIYMETSILPLVLLELMYCMVTWCMTTRVAVKWGRLWWVLSRKFVRSAREKTNLSGVCKSLIIWGEWKRVVGWVWQDFVFI